MNLHRARTVIAPSRVSAGDQRNNILALAKLRLLAVLGLFALAGAAALVRIVQLGISDPVHAARSFAETLVPSRGDIVDRNGVPLAVQFPAYALWFNPKALGGSGTALVKSPAAVASALMKIFPDENLSALTARLASEKPGYLRRRILPDEANRVLALGEPALEFPREGERYYPQGSMAASVLGFVAADGFGRLGMEEAYDKRLRDVATRGMPTALSIDIRVQGALEDELSRAVFASDAKGAAGVILDAETGEVLALASLPSFNPNLINQASAGSIFNAVTNRVYELGSVMKPITVASAIDAGVVTDFTRDYPSGAPLQIGGFRIHDSHNFGSFLTVPEALIHSSNIVMAQIGDQLGGGRLSATMAALGFNKRPVVELPARGLPLWPKSPWPRITTMTVSFGHGIAITPLHLATAYAALVNGGLLRPATLRKLRNGEIPAGKRVFKATTSNKMRELLRLIVLDGTGRRADALGFRVGGKTGSAEKATAGGYQRTALITTFAAVFPMDHPRYVVIAVLDQPQGTVATSGQRTAAWNAVPLVGRLIPRVGPLLGIMPVQNRDIDMSDMRDALPHLTLK